MANKLGDAKSKGLFIHLKLEEVLNHMLGCVRDYYSNVYGSDLRRFKESQVDFIRLLLLEARQVLKSSNYSRA